MSHTTTADPRLIPDIEAFEERVAIHIHEGGSNNSTTDMLSLELQHTMFVLKASHEALGIKVN